MIRSRSVAVAVMLLALLAQLSGVAELGLLRLVPQLGKYVQFGPQPAQAVGAYSATGGVLRVGAEMAITSVSGGTANVGSYKGTQGNHALSWSVTSNSSGLNQILYFDGVELNNANKMIVNLKASSGSATLEREYQVCDWVSTTALDDAADADCTGGGWRTLNKVKTGALGRQTIAEAAIRTFQWHVYNGYWNDGQSTTTSDVPVDTPMSNFVSPTGRVMVRAFSTTDVVTTHLINAASVELVIDPIYFPAGAEATAGTHTGESSYLNLANSPTWPSGQAGAVGSDNQYYAVSGTAEVAADFLLKFKDVRTYTGANSIAVVAEYGCSTTGINHRPKIFNFFSGAWEDLTTTSIACSATDAAGQFAFTTSSLWKYIRNGEVRVGWYGLSVGTQEIRLDYLYIIVGSTVTDTASCEISFGTGVATQCDKTQDMDSTLASTSGWMVTSELDSNTQSHDFYAYDNDADAVANEANVATHITFPVRVPSAGTLAGLVYSARAVPGSATVSLRPQFKDWWGQNAATGGYTDFATFSNSTSTYGYTDSITYGYFVSSTSHYVNSYDDTVEVRFRTVASTLLGQSFIRTFDYAMVSIRWIEQDVPRRTLQYSYLPTAGRLRVGSETAVLGATASGNTGSWKGTLGAEASDGFNWTVAATGSGIDQQLDFDHVALRGANKMVITVQASSGSALLERYYQICDWATTTAVDTGGDQDCSGGWRTLNKVAGGARASMADATRRTYTWHIYEGYWSKPGSSPTGTVNQIASTSLSNFVSSTSNGMVRIRAYSTSTEATTHQINYANIVAVIDPTYFPGGLSVITGQSTGQASYELANNPPTLISGNALTGSDDLYMRASGTASVTTDFYAPFWGVETYTGMNTIFVTAETGCSASGISYKMKVYNFTTPGWEDLTSAAIACQSAGSDIVRYVAKNNVTMSNYISNGELRIGWYGTGNGTQEIRVDYVYVILGTTNSDTASCAIDMGVISANDCASTRDIDTSNTNNLWSVTGELESAAMSHDYYPYAGDGDATSGEGVNSVLIPFGVTAATGTTPAMLMSTVRFRSGGTGLSVRPQAKDFAGRVAAGTIGWLNINTTSVATTSYAYYDPITTAISNQRLSAEDFFNFDTSAPVWIRTRSDTSTYTFTLVSDYDFFMVTYAWVEDPNSTDITLTTEGATWALDPVSPGGAEAETNFSLTVESANATGFTLSLKRNDSDTTLDLISDDTKDIADKTEWIAPGVTTVAGNAAAYTGTGLGFRVGEGSTASFFSEAWWGLDDSSLFAGVPTTSQAIAVQSMSGTAVAKVYFRLAVPSDQTVGDYDGTITATAAVNP